MADRYLPLALHILKEGNEAPLDIWSSSGRLLLAKGQRVANSQQLRGLVAYRPMMREQDFAAFQEVQRHALLRADSQRREAESPVRTPPRPQAPTLDPVGACLRLSERLRVWLRQPHETPDFADAIRSVDRQLAALAASRADDILFTLVQQLLHQTRGYSATHALLVAVVCRLLGPTLGISAAEQSSLCCAALTMNIGMAQLHDVLAEQTQPLSALQRQDIDHHPTAGVALLQQLGIQDALWLTLVRDHHERPDGSGYPAGRKDLSLLQKTLSMTDRYAALISPRASRNAMVTRAVARQLYLEFNALTDLGSLAERFVKTLGLFLPGSYVRLVNGDIAVVVRRGPRANEPLALALVNPQGMPFAQPSRRDTSRPAYAVVDCVPAETVKVRLDPARILKLL